MNQISGLLNEQLKNQQLRDDNKEFIQLCLIFLGRIPPKDIYLYFFFRIPGEVHHNRWIAKATYSLKKIYLFMDQFSLRSKEKGFWRHLFIYHQYLCQGVVQRPQTHFGPQLRVIIIKITRIIDKEIVDKTLPKWINQLCLVS